MSAIWGMISLKGDRVKEEQIQIFRRSYQNCIIDRVQEYRNDYLYMACGIQFFIKEAEHETLPIVDKKRDTYLTADILIQNREEICKKLNIQNPDQYADGTLLEQMLSQYGLHALEEILGAYAFLQFDKKNQKITMAIDAMGSRCVYYRIIDQMVYFSTLLEPLILMARSEINPTWIADFLGLDNLLMFSEAEATPIQGIYRIAPASYITITSKEVKKYRYWKPEKKIKELHLKSDDEYKQMFLDNFTAAVKRALPSEADISILLSGGYDSCSIAAIAARELKKKNKKLYSYTSVPLKEYPRRITRDIWEDETEAVLCMKEYLGNLECTFLDMEGVNPWFARQEYIKCLEFPYKSINNLLWMKEAMHKAYSKGSRIMLTGSYGNNALSFSDFTMYLKDLIHRGKFITLWEEINNFQPVYGYTKKQAAKIMLSEIFPKRKSYHNRLALKQDSYILDSLFLQTDSDQHMEKVLRDNRYRMKSYKNYRRKMVDFRLLRQIGEIQTKQSLFTGAIRLSPAKDPRFIEFCMSLPISQYIKNGQPRRLVKEYMKDYLPKEIIDNTRHGVQSPDLLFRMQKEWPRIKNEWMKIYTSDTAQRYIDTKKAIHDLNRIVSLQGIDFYDINRHAYTAMTIEYISKIENLQNC